MNKKQYAPPVVKKVKLEVKDAILAACNTSTITDPTGTLGCKVTVRCYVAPAGIIQNTNPNTNTK